ncbi:MAG: hypothetical protein ABSC02_04650 [Acidobacteriota bacterium]|jgi:hypothetical protein
MGFALRKWYFDFLTPQQQYLFVYFAYVHMFGAVIRSLTIHLAEANGGFRRTVSFRPHHHEDWIDGDNAQHIRMPEAEIVLSDAEAGIALERPECAVNLKFSLIGNTFTDPLIISTGGRRSITWRPIGLRAVVSGEARLGDRTITVHEVNGYMDHLYSTIFPLSTPVRTLNWGRIHHAGGDLVYTHAADEGMSRKWSRMYLTNESGLIETAPLVLSVPAESSLDARNPLVSDAYLLTGRTDSQAIRVRIQHVEAVQQGGFIDQQELPSAARRLLKLLTRDPHSTKFLSHAEIEIERRQGKQTWQDVPLINEVARL